MTLALAAAVTPPLSNMVPRRPARCICSRDALILLTAMFVGCQVAQTSHIAFLTTRPWFQGGDGGSDNVSPLTTLVCSGECKLRHTPASCSGAC